MQDAGFSTEEETVLDIGCGTGETLELLRRERDISVTGLDIPARPLERVRRMGLGTPEVRGLRGKLSVMGIPRRWPSLFASEVMYRFLP